MNGRFAGVAVGILVLALGCAVGLWWAELRTSSPLTSDLPEAALIVPVEEVDLAPQFAVGLAVERSPGDEARVSATGTVTRLDVQPGSVLDAGDVVAHVNDEPVVAYLGDGPLWRDLSPGDEGPDVARVQAYLEALGFDAGTVDGTFGSATAAAVTAFNRAYATGVSGDTFGLSSVAWIGDAPLTVSEVVPTVGAAVGAGETLVRGPAHLASILVSEPPGGLPGGDGYRVRVGDFETSYSPGSGAIRDAEAVARIAEELGTSGEGAGTAESTTTRPAVRVSASSVVVDPTTGKTCVYDAVDGPPIPVTILGGTTMHADLDPGVSVTTVLSNPLQMMDRPTCDSS